MNSLYHVNDVLTALANEHGVHVNDADLNDLTHHVADVLGIVARPPSATNKIAVLMREHGTAEALFAWAERTGTDLLSAEDLTDAEFVELRRMAHADQTVWRVTREDITATAQESGYVTPITDDQFERIAKAIDYSSVSECINGALEQVLTYREDA